MYYHLIPLQELKRHSVTYWRPGRDASASADTWVVLTGLEDGYLATIVDLPTDADGSVRGSTVGARSDRAENVLELFLRGAEASHD